MCKYTRTGVETDSKRGQGSERLWTQIPQWFKVPLIAPTDPEPVFGIENGLNFAMDGARDVEKLIRQPGAYAVRYLINAQVFAIESLAIVEASTVQHLLSMFGRVDSLQIEIYRTRADEPGEDVDTITHSVWQIEERPSRGQRGLRARDEVVVQGPLRHDKQFVLKVLCPLSAGPNESETGSYEGGHYVYDTFRVVSVDIDDALRPGLDHQRLGASCYHSFG